MSHIKGMPRSWIFSIGGGGGGCFHNTFVGLIFWFERIDLQRSPKYKAVFWENFLRQNRFPGTSRSATFLGAFLKL